MLNIVENSQQLKQKILKLVKKTELFSGKIR